MSISQAAARIYAKALFDIGVEGGSLEGIADDLHGVHDAIGGLDPQLQVFFELPQLRRDDKLRRGRHGAPGQGGPPGPRVARSSSTSGASRSSPPSSTSSTALLDVHVGRVRANVLTAHPLIRRLADALRTAIERSPSGRSCCTNASTPASSAASASASATSSSTAPFATARRHAASVTSSMA